MWMNEISGKLGKGELIFKKIIWGNQKGGEDAKILVFGWSFFIFISSLFPIIVPGTAFIV